MIKQESAIKLIQNVEKTTLTSTEFHKLDIYR